MSAPERASWVQFYRRYPFDDHARFNIPAAISAWAAGVPWEKAMEIIVPKVDDVWAGYSEAEVTTMKTFGLKAPPVNRKAAAKKAAPAAKKSRTKKE